MGTLMLQATAVATDGDVETLRQIRNSGRQWMTRATAEITPDQQRAWWAQRNAKTCRVWLFRIADTAVGYGLLRLEHERWWCSLAVLPRFQGQGYGGAIYRYLACACDGDTWAEILADNRPSLRACLGAGFDLHAVLDRQALLVYRHA